MFDTMLLAKILVSGGIVLGLSLLAERIGPRVAGVLSGAPWGAVMVYFFLGIEMDSKIVVASVPHAIAGLNGTLLFVYAYYRASLWSSRFGILVAPAVGIAAFMVVVLVLSLVSFSSITALALTGVVTLTAGLLFRTRMVNLRISWRVRMTPGIIAFRTGLSMFFVVSIVALAKVMGPTWAGLLVGFPMTLLPLLLIIHMTYSKEHTHAIIRNFPIGMVSLIIYLLSIPFTFPAFGISLGTIASLSASVIYLVGLSFFMTTRSRFSID